MSIFGLLVSQQWWDLIYPVHLRSRNEKSFSSLHFPTYIVALLSCSSLQQSMGHIATEHLTLCVYCMFANDEFTPRMPLSPREAGQTLMGKRWLSQMQAIGTESLGKEPLQSIGTRY